MLDFDAIIIGGSYAGLSVAMALGRARRRVLILDTGRPCNRQTPHSHNFLTQDGATPAALRAQAIEQVLRYPTTDDVARPFSPRSRAGATKHHADAD